MKILLTGGSGFIGTHLIDHFLGANSVDKIVNLDLKDSSITNIRLESIKSDIRRPDLLNLPLNDSFDLCIHLAALCKEPGYEWDEYFETNHIGTKNIMALCEKLKINKIIFTSTMMVYKAGEVKRTEQSITAPDTAYGISKLLGEKELESWVLKDKKRWLKIIRPAVVFGENENANFTRLYFSIKKGFFPYVGKSATIKANIYVKELVRFIEFLSESKTKENIYNFSFPEEYSMKEIINTFEEVFQFKSFNPVLPLWLLLGVSYVFEFFNALGLKNSIHHRRIEKLYYSTDIYPENGLKEGYKFRYNLKRALEDWRNCFFWSV